MTDNAFRYRIMKKAIKFASLLLLSISFLNISVLKTEASVQAATNTYGDADTIYVAGSPNTYPMEYYNPDTGCFEGIMPQILNRISEETGLSFTYLYDGSDNARVRMVKNGQIDIVSCVLSSDRDLMDVLKSHSDAILTGTSDGLTTEYYFGYIELSSPELIEQINRALEDISPQELNGMFVRMDNNRLPVSYRTLWIVTGSLMLLMLLSVSVLSFFLYKQKKKKSKKSNSRKELTIAELQTQYNENIDHALRKVYSIIYFSFDTERTARLYGLSSVTVRLSAAVKDILSDMGMENSLYNDGRGVTVLKLSGGKDHANVWAEKIIAHLNSSIASSSPLLMRAGIYNLKSDDDECTIAIQNAKQCFLSAQEHHQDILSCTDTLLQQIKDCQILVKDFEQGIESKEFYLYLQPIVNADTQQIAGAEALARWEHPTRGMLKPSEFVDVLSQSGVIRQLEFYVFELVCNQLHDWYKQGVDYFISCNFTRQSIESDSFCNDLLSCVEKYKFDHAKLVLEITEDVMENNRSRVMNNIVTCREAGFQIALDDFGSGITSFADLCDFPLDIIKIDKSMLQKANTAKGRAILKAVTRLAREMKYLVLCEGVETAEETEMVRNMHCSLIQGFLFYRPMPIDAFQKHIRV